MIFSFCAIAAFFVRTTCGLSLEKAFLWEYGKGWRPLRDQAFENLKKVIAFLRGMSKTYDRRNCTKPQVTARFG